MNTACVRIVILVDNTAGPGLVTEHGLSMWIEFNGRRILFDTGQGQALVPNAATLGVDLSLADDIVLSHGHYDHTGGLAAALRYAPKARLHCHPGATTPRYAIRNGTAKPIQMPRESMAALDRLPGGRLDWVQGPVLLGERIGLTGPIARTHAFEDPGGPFFLDPEGKRPDAIDDDLALWIGTDQGVIACVGCCHAGLLNTLDQIRQVAGDERIRAIIGGLHLLQASPERLDRTIDALKRSLPELIIPCHCTGDSATAALRAGLGSRVTPGSAGMSWQW